MGKASSARYKARKKKEAADRINFGNAKPHQIAALEAERARLMAAAEKDLPKGKAALLAKQRDGGRIK